MWTCSKQKDTHKTESVVSEQPARIAQADLKRHVTQMSECPFSCVVSHMVKLIDNKNLLRTVCMVAPGGIRLDSFTTE